MDKLLEITVGEALRERAEKSNDKEFIVFPNRNIRYTFGDIDRRSAVLSKGLLAFGFKKGDHIGIWAHNVSEWAPVFYAIARAGFIIVPINVNCRHREIAYMIGHSDIKGLFFIDKYRDTDLAEILYQIIPELKGSEAGKLKAEQFPFLKAIICMNDAAHGGMYNLDEIIKMGDALDNTVLQKAEEQVGSRKSIFKNPPKMI